MKGTPAKVAWYLPIIPRLKYLFANPKEAKMFRWHAEERKPSDGKLRHPADAIQWRNIDRKHPQFTAETRNVSFALSTDGMNIDWLMPIVFNHVGHLIRISSGEGRMGNE